MINPWNWNWSKIISWTMIVGLSLLLILSFWVLRIADDDRLFWAEAYTHLSQDITRSGCKVAEAADGRFYIYDCRWYPADSVYYGCGYLANGSAAPMTAECLARGPR
jgi:hypothetical protein